MMTPQYKYALIKSELRNKIESGELKPHDKLLTQSQIIAKYNTSVTTAGRVLNELAFEGYAYRVQGKGTFVAERKRRIRNLCFAVPFIVRENMSMSYPASSSILLDHIYNECRECGWSVRLHISPAETPARAAALQDSLHGVDGVILCQAFKPGIEEEIEVLKASGIPFVVLDTFIDRPDLTIVSSDGHAAAFELTARLHGKGCDHIVFWGRTNENADTSMLVRRKGYQAAVAQMHLPEELYLHSILPSSFESDVQKAGAHIAGLPGTVGILSDHVGHLQALCDCIMQNNYPTSALMLANFDLYPVRLHPSVPIFSMSRPFDLMAKLSMTRLIELCDGTWQPTQSFLPSILRATWTVSTLSQHVDLFRDQVQAAVGNL